jgi:Fe-S cluster assembly protein SufD
VNEQIMNLALAKTTTAQTGTLDGTFAAARERLPGSGPVVDVRQQAFDDFAKNGLPTRRVEEWKYTDLRVLMRDVAPLAPVPDKAALGRAASAIQSLGIDGSQKLVLVDGVFAPELSSSFEDNAGVRVQLLNAILDDESNAVRADLLRTLVSDPMLSLNAALATDGVVVFVREGATPSNPIHIVHVATSSRTAAVTRSLIKVDAKAKVTLIESFVSANGVQGYQTHDAVVLWIGDDADVQHVRLMDDAIDAANISSAIVTIGSRCQFNTFSLTSGGAVSRYQSFIKLAGENSNLTTNGVNLLRGQQHGDCTFVIEHAVPNCTSREVFRAVLDDRARSVFQGRLIVKPLAQKTDGKMMTRALLLSDEAEVDNKPELEIFADDVACGHGATVGALDESLLFYLRARGLPERAAQALLIQAFVGEALESIVDDQLREIATSAAVRWLEARSS